MKLAALLLIVVCTFQFTSAGFFEKIQEKLTPSLGLRLSAVPQRAKVVMNKIQSTLTRRPVPESNFTMPLLGGSGGLRDKNQTQSTTPAALDTDDLELPATEIPPTKSKYNAKDVDTCGGSILVDLKSSKIQMFKSPRFPSSRSKPSTCSWRVKVGKNCQLGRVKLTVQPGSRLANELHCTKGYFRVVPFMKEAKICGSISSVPPFTWMVDQSQAPEDVSIVMKSIGLNDGEPEGLAFTVTGECVNDIVKSGDITTTNLELSSQWLSAVQELQHIKDVTIYSTMSILPASKLSAVANEKISVDADGDEDADDGAKPTAPIKRRYDQLKEIVGEFYSHYTKRFQKIKE